MIKEKFLKDKIAVIGAGSWGTTLANLLANKGINVSLWVREDDVFDQIKKERINRIFLPDILLSEKIHPTQSFEEVIEGKDLIVMAVPSHVFREVLLKLKPYIHGNVSIISATKGIENSTLMLMSDITKEVLDREVLFSCIAGPSFAKEVSKRLPTAVTIACKDIEHAMFLQKIFYTEYFRVYVSKDIIGVQLGGALKNVIAIASGISDGLGIGTNARAALITRGLAEISRLGVKLGAEPLTFAGLAGMGDLVLTCTGDLSRNRTVGLRIAEGLRLKEIVSGMKMVAEGIKTTKSAYELSKRMEVEMPIVEQVYRILYEDKNPKDAVKELMTRQLKIESF